MELVIVIAIVIILSVISVPIYQGYTYKAKMTEGYALLGSILSAQKAYYSEYGNFLRHSDGSGWTSCDTFLGVDARGNKRFTWFRGGSGSNAVKTYFSAAARKPAELIEINGMSFLALEYNIDSGATVRELEN